MQICQKHWAALRAALEERGLLGLGAQNAQEATAAIVTELEGRGAENAFDPLLSCNHMICGQGLKVVGLSLLTQQGGCPVCEALRGYEDWWIFGPADAMLKEAHEKGLVPVFKLQDLEPKFLKITSADGHSSQMVDDLAEAQGLMFLCPKCFKKNGGNVGTHAVICWFAGRGVPDEVSPKPGRWTPAGTGYADLTFVPTREQPATSVRLTSGCTWHGHVANGEVSILPDSYGPGEDPNAVSPQKT